jgi:hypothetical protein
MAHDGRHPQKDAALLHVMVFGLIVFHRFLSSAKIIKQTMKNDERR